MLFLLSVVSATPGFDPKEFLKQTVTCKAPKKDSRTVVDITSSYVDINSEADVTLLLVHGWPGLWSTWSNQIQDFKEDYRLIVPDLRGFGGSTSPGDIQTSGSMPDLVGDLMCILQHARVDSAICIGHDWGSAVCYEAGRSRPDIFKAVVGAVVPYIPAAGPFVATKDLAAMTPGLAYELFFSEKTSAAVAELNANVRRTIRATLRTVDSPPPKGFLTDPNSFLGGWKGVAQIPPVPFFTSIEEDYYVDQYNRQKFSYTLQFYTDGNRRASWEFAHAQGNHTLTQPVLSIMPNGDPVADWVNVTHILESHKFLPHLTTAVIAGAHWPQLENPVAFNHELRKWLSKTVNLIGQRAKDEL
ncbi:alpha/beta-hydrolase [Fistulina hepatica ATCC 64428]|uniref:Alpha/beta-hydrolase n=1 Tax=Fistulina hepatica ATCC 64428 TaxID=1128425 RepID=A0A0D7ABU8_9AGAR|nr:alpha/beta-hydrolase [Fistulina hepatica ATCC 64428]